MAGVEFPSAGVGLLLTAGVGLPRAGVALPTAGVGLPLTAGVGLPLTAGVGSPGDDTEISGAAVELPSAAGVGLPDGVELAVACTVLPADLDEAERVTAPAAPFGVSLGAAAAGVPNVVAAMPPAVFVVIRNCGTIAVADAVSDGASSSGAAAMSPTRAAGTQSSPVRFRSGLATLSHSPSRPSTVNGKPASTRVRMRPPTPGQLTIGVLSCCTTVMSALAGALQVALISNTVPTATASPTALPVAPVDCFRPNLCASAFMTTSRFCFMPDCSWS